MEETRKYKQTELGLLPEDWEVKRIVDIATITTGSQNTQDKVDGGKYPFYVRSQNVERIDTYIYDTEGVVTAGDGVGTGKIFHRVRGKFGLHQRCYLMHNLLGVNVDYFYWIFSIRFYERVMGMTAKSSVDSVRREMIADMLLPIPPIEEQRRIASALTSIDNLIDSLDRLIAKKRDIKQGAMQQLLSGKKRLKGFTEPWVEKKLGDVVTNSIGLTYSPNNVKKYGTLVLRSSNIKNGKLIFEDNVFVEMSIPERAKVHTNDLLVCVRNGSKALIGKSAVITEDAEGMAFGAFMTILRANGIEQIFLNYYWQTDFIQKQVRDNMGATINQITNADISDFDIYVPSYLPEQQAIASVLTSMDNELSALEAKRKKYEQIKQGMMQQLLTGRIRLI